MCEKFAHTRFEPSGWSHNQDIGYAKSIMDYIFRWLQLRFLTGQQQALFDGLRPKYVNAPPPGTPEERRRPENVWRFCRRKRSGFSVLSSRLGQRSGVEGPAFARRWLTPPHASDALKDLIDLGDAPSCHVCGAIMTRNGSCYRCNECGSASGCS